MISNVGAVEIAGTWLREAANERPRLKLRLKRLDNHAKFCALVSRLDSRQSEVERRLT
jgi:hypothetical protein